MSLRTSKDIKPGAVVTKQGRSKDYRTGDWRSLKPKYNAEKCIKCGLCYIVCPEAAIKICGDGKIEVNDFYCKGCGICATECPPKAFDMVPLDEDE